MCLHLLWPQPVPDILTPFYVAGGSYHLTVPVYSLCESSVVQTSLAQNLPPHRETTNIFKVI